MASKTCVAPPVGSGNAGVAMRTTNSSAKLFSPKNSIRPPSVLSPSLANQRSSSSLILGELSPRSMSADTFEHRPHHVGQHGRRPADGQRLRARAQPVL